jgi:hypothetical protein
MNRTRCPSCNELALLEKWDIGISMEDPLFNVSYDGVCMKCNWSLSFKLLDQELTGGPFNLPTVEIFTDKWKRINVI